MRRLTFPELVELADAGGRRRVTDLNALAEIAAWAVGLLPYAVSAGISEALGSRGACDGFREFVQAAAVKFAAVPLEPPDEGGGS